MKKENVFNSKIDTGYSEDLPKIDLAEFEKVIQSRRSVRIFEPESVPETVIQKALDHGMLAPNSSNLQPWEFHWVRSQEIKSKLATLCFSQNGAKTASDLIVCVAKTNTWKESCQLNLDAFKHAGVETPKVAEDYYKSLAPKAYGLMGPFGIFSPFKWLFFNIVGLFNLVPREPMFPHQLKLWASKTTALACENIMLSLRAQGYDSLAMEGYDGKRVKSLLKLGSHDHPVMIIACGKRASSGVYGPRVRFDQKRFIKKY